MFSLLYWEICCYLFGIQTIQYFRFYREGLTIYGPQKLPKRRKQTKISYSNTISGNTQEKTTFKQHKTEIHGSNQNENCMGGCTLIRNGWIKLQMLIIYNGGFPPTLRLQQKLFIFLIYFKIPAKLMTGTNTGTRVEHRIFWNAKD